MKFSRCAARLRHLFARVNGLSRRTEWIGTGRLPGAQLRSLRFWDYPGALGRLKTSLRRFRGLDPPGALPVLAFTGATRIGVHYFAGYRPAGPQRQAHRRGDEIVAIERL